MKEGATYNLLVHLDIEKKYDDVIFTLKAKKKTLSKTATQDQDGVFIIPLTQEDTINMSGNVQIEAQINYHDLSVQKSNVKMVYINESLATKINENNAPSDNDGIDAVLDVIKGDVALLITPESSAELIAAVTQIFNDTKSIAQSVRDDADNGVFDGKDGIDGQDGKDGADGQDGFSPTVSVKTQTADTYILDITDKNGTTETPNLKGPKGDKGDSGVSTAGSGIDITNNVISAKLKQDGYLLVTEDGIYVDISGLGWAELLRDNLSTDDGSTNYPLAKKRYVDTEVAKKQNTINASNKLNADYLSDGTTSKPSYWNKAPKMYRGNGQPSTTSSSYIGIRTGDFYLDEHQDGNGNMHLYQCTFNYMDSLIWKEVSYTSNIKQVPTSTSADSGKFLRVNAQGNAEWQTVPSARGEEF